MRTREQPSTGVLLSLLALLALPACATRAIQERCGLVAADASTPSLPPDFAELDSLLVQRARSMASAARGLERSLLVLYRREFLERLLPGLCGLVEEDRTHAARGNTSEAGTRYQALLVVAQVMQLEVALAQTAALADEAGQPSASIAAILEDFDRDMLPLMEAALSLDRSRLVAAMPEGARWYNIWLGRLDEWGRVIERNARMIRTALLVADVLMIAFAAYDLAAVTARGGIASPPPLAGIAGGGVAVAMRVDAAAIARAVEAIRKLVASGALDPVVVAGLSVMGRAPGFAGPAIQRPMAMGSTSGANNAAPVPPPKVAKRIEVSKKRFGEAAQHAEDAMAQGKQRFLTIDRTGINQRRAEALNAHSAKPGFDRDEYPPAMFKEGGRQASVRHIDAAKNQSLGAYLGNLCRGLPDGAVIELVIVP